jgi:D-sedoheptulose 7-phosphate isomerase
MPPGHEDRKWDSPSDAGHSIQKYFHDLGALIPRLPFGAIDTLVSVLLQACEEERTVFVFGNGGSAASASHMMCDMNKGTADLNPPRRAKVMALTDNVSLLTAWANDFGYERVFSEQLKSFVQPRDVAFAISTSGDSPNVLLALETAREYGAITVGLAGCEGGRMQPLCDICAVVPSDNVQVIEDLHHAMIHAIFTAVRESFLAGTAKAPLARAASF